MTSTGDSYSLQRGHPALWFAGVILALTLAHALTWVPSEPFFNNDETRHVMTGVFFRDFLLDLPFDRLRAYTVDYYLQYPALGLMVWPPLFHGLEGVAMLLFGTSFLVAKGLVWIFAAVACASLFLLVRRTHDTRTAAAATLLFGLSPLVFQFTRHVMLEMPALAFLLASVYFFVRYLDLDRRRDLFLAAGAAAAFALTRYDALVLLLFFALTLAARRRWDLFRRREVWLAAVLALLAVLPLYLPMLIEFGRAHLQLNVARGPSPESRGLWSSLTFYPQSLPRQIGVLPLVAALAGLLSTLRPERRRACWPYLVLIAATWLAFSPLAAPHPRRAIYWVPAFALLAVEGVGWLAGRLRLPQARTVLASLLIAGAFWASLRSPSRYLRGYEEAARYVVENTQASRFSFVDGYLNGTFIYQVHRHDPDRRLWVLRGDKLLYGVLMDPRSGYQEHAGSESEILRELFHYDPELIVVEEPQVAYEMPAATRLREVLAAHPERYELVREFPIESNVAMFEGVRLNVYRSRLRNPAPARQLSFGMLGLGRSLQAKLPD